ncbi:MAG TPA: isoprenylcysteine carboxylmethyltransferase family protein [Phycisphaerales bacterium]|nr:isoprenylcysteine carboxylmethyltransferase family protein [Phycisphaerales bacterium]
MLKGRNTFEIVFLVGFVAGSVVRNAYMARCKGVKLEKQCSNVLDFILVSTAGVGMIVPLLYLFTPWLDFAKYNLPGWSGWVGIVAFAGAIFMLWRSHADLGRNWSAKLRITGQHSLVTNGVYRYIRHPMYTSHTLWAIAQGLLLSNWLAGWAFLVLSLPLYIVRIPKEERMMLEHFGEEYRQYMSRTGRLVPRVWK